MQFPVPQFTEVEDKIIGPLTVRQFFILLVTAGIIFFSYSLSKDYYVTGAAGFLVGVPGLLLTFGQFNGRPMYSSIIVFLNFLTKPRFFVFHKEAENKKTLEVKDLKQQPVAKPTEPGDDTRSKLKKVAYQLQLREEQEKELLSTKQKITK